jgi:hypothetical protein
VVFFLITCDACSASPPLCEPRTSENDSIATLKTEPKAHLTYRISLPMPPAFRGLTSKPLRTAFSVGVACWTPCCSKANPNRSALPPSVHTSVARARRILDTGFDGREGPCENLDRSGSARFFCGVEGRGGGLRSLGGFNSLVEFEECGLGIETGAGGGERIRVRTGAGMFSFGTSASCAERELFPRQRLRSTTGEGFPL